MRRKDETLRETLLQCTRAIIAEQGIEAVSIRILAQKAGISTGTVYNYFADKEEILLALTEEYWNDAMTELRQNLSQGNFCTQLGEVYSFLSDRVSHSAGVLMHSLRPVETAGRGTMHKMLGMLRGFFYEKLLQDKQIRPDVWDDSFTPERFAGFVLVNLLTLLRSSEPDIEFLLALVQRTLYSDAGQPALQKIV